MTTRPNAAVIAHRTQGDGPPVVLLNGGLMSLQAWDPIASQLERDCLVIRCDFRGQLLTLGDPPASLAGHADDVVALLDALGRADAHIAGVSFGALVGLVIAARHPTRIRSLVAMSATDRVTDVMWAGSLALCEAARHAAAGGGKTAIFDVVEPATFSPEWRAANAEMLRARRMAVGLLPPSWFAGVAGLVAALEGLTLHAELARIQCPTCVVGGEHDLTFPIEHSRELASRIAGAILEVVPSGSHGFIVERPAEAAAIIGGFVARVEQKR